MILRVFAVQAIQPTGKTAILALDRIVQNPCFPQDDEWPREPVVDNGFA
jgi:hypothetical protein